jgi:hypothetical protein
MRRFIAACVIAAACAGAAFAQDDFTRRAIDESRKLAAQVSLALRNQLVKEMQVSGPVRSLIACKYSCPEIISGPSRKTGWRVSAVSLKPRNPALGAPDAWEQKVLLDFDRRVAKGEKAESLEIAEIVSEPQGKFFRYAIAMPVEPLCLACHGKAESLAPAVKAQLEVDYPFDRAIGFSTGQVYGIVAIKRPL